VCSIILIARCCAYFWNKNSLIIIVDICMNCIFFTLIFKSFKCNNLLNSCFNSGEFKDYINCSVLSICCKFHTCCYFFSIIIKNNLSCFFIHKFTDHCISFSFDQILIRNSILDLHIFFCFNDIRSCCCIRCFCLDFREFNCLSFIINVMMNSNRCSVCFTCQCFKYNNIFTC